MQDDIHLRWDSVKNLWIQTERAFATWEADLTRIRKQPAKLVDVVRCVLRAGTKHGIFDVVEAPLIGYRRERNGDLGDVIARMYQRDQVVDLFGFMGLAMNPGLPESSTVETTLCYYDRADTLIEQPVTDLGAVLASLEPVPGSIAKGFKTHMPAVRITGRRYTDVREGVTVDARPRRPPMVFQIGIHSDIWYPYVMGAAHPLRDHVRMFDNIELALCHTPRLNAFLGEVAEATRAAGGVFELFRDETLDPRAVDDSSVNIDWIPSEGIMPPEALDAEWF
jgi:hypothetical protein